MAKVLIRDGRVVISGGKVRVGADGDPCCCTCAPSMFKAKFTGLTGCCVLPYGSKYLLIPDMSVLNDITWLMWGGPVGASSLNMGSGGFDVQRFNDSACTTLFDTVQYALRLGLDSSGLNFDGTAASFGSDLIVDFYVFDFSVPGSDSWGVPAGMPRDGLIFLTDQPNTTHINRDSIIQNANLVCPVDALATGGSVLITPVCTTVVITATDPVSTTIPKEGLSGSITFTATGSAPFADGEWYATRTGWGEHDESDPMTGSPTSVEFLHITSATSGVGDSVITFTIDANPLGGDIRKGAVVVNNKSFVFTQQANPV